jgi:hypothetical protein
VKFTGLGVGGHLNDRRGMARGIEGMGVRNRKCGSPHEASIRKFNIPTDIYITFVKRNDWHVW